MLAGYNSGLKRNAVANSRTVREEAVYQGPRLVRSRHAAVTRRDDEPVELFGVKGLPPSGESGLAEPEGKIPESAGPVVPLVRYLLWV